MRFLDDLRMRAAYEMEKNGKWVIIVLGGAFALLALVNLGAAITLGVIIASISYALGLWKMDP